MLANKIESSCKNLVQIDSILQLKQRRLKNILLMLGEAHQEEEMSIQKVRFQSPERMQNSSPYPKTGGAKLELNLIVKELDTLLQTLRIELTVARDQYQQLLLNPSQEQESSVQRELIIKQKEDQIQRVLQKTKDAQFKKQIQLKQLESQFDLNNKIYEEYTKQFEAREAEIQKRERELRENEERSRAQQELLENREREIQKWIETRVPQSEFDRLQEQQKIIEQKLQTLAKQDINLTQKQQKIDQQNQANQKREQKLQELEKNIIDKRNQLFKSYDILTEKIYEFERECDRLRNQKRKLLLQQQSFNTLIANKFDQLQSKQLEILEKSYMSGQNNHKVEEQEKLLVPKIEKERIYQYLSNILNGLKESTQVLETSAQNLTQNKDKILEKIRLDNQLNLDANVEEALDQVFSVGFGGNLRQSILSRELISPNKLQQIFQESAIPSLLDNTKNDQTDQFFFEDQSFKNKRTSPNKDQRRVDSNVNAESLRLSGTAKISDQVDDFTLDELNQALILPVNQGMDAESSLIQNQALFGDQNITLKLFLKITSISKSLENNKTLNSALQKQMRKLIKALLRDLQKSYDLSFQFLIALQFILQRSLIVQSQINSIYRKQNSIIQNNSKLLFTLQSQIKIKLYYIQSINDNEYKLTLLY